MTIPDEAVQAAHAEYHKVLGDSNRSNPMLAAITAALPFLQGVKVESIDTAPKNGDEFLARCGKDWPWFSCFWDGSAFVHYDHKDGLIGYPATEWIPLPDARIMSAIEIPTTSKMEAVAPSPRVQALEEARRQAIEDVLGALTAHELYQYRPKAFQGFIDYARNELSSQPVEDGWLPIETAPNNQAIMVHYDDGNIEIITADDNDYSWIAYTVKEDFVTKTTHWRPLPASPGASE